MKDLQITPIPHFREGRLRLPPSRAVRGRFLRKACSRFFLPPLEKGNNPLTPPLERGMGGFDGDSEVKCLCSENPPKSNGTDLTGKL
jgi:hypothetical protein